MSDNIAFLCNKSILKRINQTFVNKCIFCNDINYIVTKKYIFLFKHSQKKGVILSGSKG